MKKKKKELKDDAFNKRFEKIFKIAQKVFENQETAFLWLIRRQYGLGGRFPIEVMRTQKGAEEVENLLWQIEYGVLP